MIVKNESEVIQRCLRSVRGIIDYWVVVDTGSCDNTKDLIRESLGSIPGELHERPWVNFEKNRNEALALAKGDYILFIDADEELVLFDDFSLDSLDRDCYLIAHRLKEFDFHRTFLIRNIPGWAWKGVLHETISNPNAKSYAVLGGAVKLCHEGGARSVDPEKFSKDVQLLEQALLEEPDNERTVFYLAQSALKAQDFPRALKYYEKRAAMGGCPQEVFWSLYLVAGLQQQMGQDPEIVVKNYWTAFKNRPTRFEPLYGLATFYYGKGDYRMSQFLAETALSIPVSTDSLFVERWMAEWGFSFLSAVSAYRLGSRDEKVFLTLLENPQLPSERKSQVEAILFSFKKQRGDCEFDVRGL